MAEYFEMIISAYRKIAEFFTIFRNLILWKTTRFRFSDFIRARKPLTLFAACCHEHTSLNLMSLYTLYESNKGPHSKPPIYQSFLTLREIEFPPLSTFTLSIQLCKPDTGLSSEQICCITKIKLINLRVLSTCVNTIFFLKGENHSPAPIVRFLLSTSAGVQDELLCCGCIKQFSVRPVCHLIQLVSWTKYTCLRQGRQENKLHICP